MTRDKHFYIESFDTVALSSFRIEQSPFADRYVTDQTVFCLYCDRLYPVKMAPDEDPLPKYWKLRRGVLLYDVPEKPLEIIGPDAVTLLERVLTCRVETLRRGPLPVRHRLQLRRHRPDGRCDHAAGGGSVLVRQGERRVRELVEGEWSRPRRGRSPIPNSRVLQIQGPRSLDVLDAAIGGGLPADFKYFRASFFDVCGQTLWVSRTGWTGEVGIEIYCNSGPEPTDHGALWDGLFVCGEPFGMEFSSSFVDGHPAHRIRDSGQRHRHRARPHAFRRRSRASSSGSRRIDFIGRTALESADRSQLLFGLVCATATPEAGTEVHSGNGPVGHVTIGTWSPTLETGVGYVRFDRPLPGDDWLGKTVLLRDRDGNSHEAIVDTLPFVDKEKQLPRAAWGGPNVG